MTKILTQHIFVRYKFQIPTKRSGLKIYDSLTLRILPILTKQQSAIRESLKALFLVLEFLNTCDENVERDAGFWKRVHDNRGELNHVASFVGKS